MTLDDDERTANSEDEGSESHLNRDGEGEQANTHVPSTPQQEMQQCSAWSHLLKLRTCKNTCFCAKVLVLD